MKFTIKKPDLLFALDTAASIVEPRGTMPILRNVKIDAYDGAVHVTATDLDMQADCETPTVTLSQPGKTTVPAKTLRDIANKANADTIDITVTDTAMKVRAGASVFALGTLPAEDFPVISFQNAASIVFKMPAPALKRILERTRHAISSEETRYYLNGIYLHASPASADMLRGVATNGHALAAADDIFAADTHADVHGSIPALILPRKAAQTLHGLLGTLESDVEITMADNGITFALGNMVT